MIPFSSFEAFGDLDEQSLSFLKGTRPARDPLRERFSFDELHDEKLPGAGLFVTVERRDVCVVERGQEFRFTLEAVETFSGLGEIVGQDFDGDVTAELGVARAIDLAHATGPDGLENLVMC